MFLGITTLNLDSKGRLAIPAKHRDALRDSGASVFVTINPLEPCLWMYPAAEWQEIAHQLSRLPTMDNRSRLMKRLILGHSHELELDGQGRILLSVELREYAGLDKLVSVVGEGEKFEIWDTARWNEQRDGWLAQARQSGSELSAELSNLSL